ncbi:unnamed protein product [Auanema sp. JU1783]|nr:unnamed protein product [Auanema sp. JU1783]
MASANGGGFVSESGGMSIADMVRQAATEVYHSRVPDGFEWISEYGQYYSRESNFFYDPNTGLFYSPDNQTYYVFNDETREYEIYRCAQKLKWRNKKYEHWAEDFFGENFCKISQETVEVVEVVFGMVDSISGGPQYFNLDMPVLEAKTRKKKGRDEKPKGREYIQTEDPNLVIYQEVDNVLSPCLSDSSDEYWSIGWDGSIAEQKERLKQEEGFSHPPCLRIIDETNKLFVITMTGGIAGSSEQLEIELNDFNLPPKVLEFSYVQESSCYIVKKISDKASVTLNDFYLELEDDREIVHGDFLRVGKSRLYIHVHYGNNTCNGCEPGLLKSREQPVSRVVSGETARRRNLKMLKAAFGVIGGSDSHVNRGFDRAAKRRKEVGSEIDIKRASRPNGPADPNNIYANCSARPVPGSVPLPKQGASASSVSSENKGFKLLKGMGWKEGEGLGKSSAGRVEPIINNLKANRAGLGSDNTDPSKPITSSKDAILDVTRKRYEEIEKSEK